MLIRATGSLLVVATLLVTAAAAAPPAHQPRQERVEHFGALVPLASPRSTEAPAVRVERVTTAVPWPRGLAFVDGELVVLARGRHRRAGGLDPTIPDRAGMLFAVDPAVAEPFVPGAPVSDAVRTNGRVLAEPTSPPFLLYHGAAPLEQASMIDRPYCTLAFDEASRNLFICGYSGVDMPRGRFRKNATDSIHRYDLRTRTWHTVELHDHAIVPEDELGYVVSNEHYPHHDPATNPPPHGWINGGDGGCAAGEFLYFAGKDNHVVVQYELAAIRRDPAAAPPRSRPVLGSRVVVRHPGGEGEMELLGPSAIAARDGHLYVGYRTSSVVVRFPLDARGELDEPARGELIAVFEPWDAEARRSANLIDIAFNGRGELFVSCATEGRVWNVGMPDPARPFYGNDQTARKTTAPPHVDLARALGKRVTCGNIAFDAQDRLYITSGAAEVDGSPLRGVVYRVEERRK